MNEPRYTDWTDEEWFHFVLSVWEVDDRDIYVFRDGEWVPKVPRSEEVR